MDHDADRYLEYLRTRLSPNRLRHSQGVAGVMVEAAAVYGIDLAQAAAAGLLHDAAKELVGEEQTRWLRAAGVETDPMGDDDYNLYSHGPAGAAMVSAELGFSDPAVLGAIITHTFWGGGAYYHAPLTWLLRFADLIEPNRGWHNVPWLRARLGRIRALIDSGRMQEAALLQTGWIIRLFAEQNAPVHKNLPRCLEELRKTAGKNPGEAAGADFWDRK